MSNFMAKMRQVRFRLGKIQKFGLVTLSPPLQTPLEKLTALRQTLYLDLRGYF